MRSANFWNVTIPRILTIYSFAVFVFLWIGFAIALMTNIVLLDQLWNWVRALHLSIAGDHPLGAFSAHYGWVVDLGIILANDFPLVGDSRIGGLDIPACVQFDQRRSRQRIFNE